MSSQETVADPPSKRRRVENAPLPTSNPTLHGSHETEPAENRLLASGQPTLTPNSPASPKSVQDDVKDRDNGKAKIALDADQAAIVDLICERNSNVFLTGPAGVGKSVVIQVAVERLQAQGKAVYKVAPTGIAAVGIGGSTLHHYLGTSPSDSKKSLRDLTKVKQVKNARQFRVSKTDVLIIDEISMVSHFAFQRLDTLLRSGKNPREPFGGIQMIVTGDFCQLPPVKPFEFCWGCGKEPVFNYKFKKYECKENRAHGTWAEHDKWAFKSQSWKRAKFEHRSLKKVHRQSDVQFIGYLQKIRLGHNLSATEKEALMAGTSNSANENSIRLYPKKQDVEDYNKVKYDGLLTESHSYQCLDEFGNPAPCYDGEKDVMMGPWQRDHRYEANLHLKLHMPVVLIANLDVSQGLVNGAQGTIIGFEAYDPSRLPRKADKGAEGKSATNETRSEATEDAPILGGRFAAYREEQITRYVTGLAYEDQCWPRVRFLNNQVCTILPDCAVEAMDCTVERAGQMATSTSNEPFKVPQHLLSRTQIPLKAGWALTVHKSQGMTLDRVVVDLAHAFERGQVYVALSRVRSRDGLTIQNWPEDPNHVFADEEVVHFMEENDLV